MKNSLKAVLCFIFLLILTNKAAGQNLTPSEQLRENVIQQERSRSLRESSRELSRDATAQQDESAQEAVITLKEIIFSKSHLLPEEFFQKIKEKYENTQANENDIFAIVAEINNEYMMRGFIASHAYLKEQDITSGVLFVSLIEGVISAVKITGNKTTNENYIKRYMDFSRIDAFNINVTNQDIMDFNAANDAKARIALSAGKVFGTTDVDIIIDEPEMFSFNAFVDNSGQEETGRIRYGGFGTVRSLTGYRDVLNAGGVFSEGSNAAYISYEIPTPFFKMRAGAGFDYSDTKIINGGLRALEVKGNFYNAYIYLKKAVLARETTATNITFNAGSRRGESSVSAFKTQDTKTDTLSLSGDNTIIFKRGYLFNSISYTQGVRLIEGDSAFEKIAYYGEWYQSLPYNFGFNVKARGQFAVDTVPSSEQFSIGGINTVRGYREGMLIAVNGLNANSQLEYDLSFIKKHKFFKYADYCKVYGFFDLGSIFPENKANLPDNHENTIYSSGIGIKTGIFNHITAQLIWAIPIVNHTYYQNDGSSFLFVINGRI
ncbi:MAG: BamA/TamA family outer membrane protein [Endomicrobia bacterium]|nr:BamA/TamA family outer membrane protein [Endomicrobiia bacterium]